MPLLPQRTTKEMRSATSFHADHSDFPIRSEVQQLQSRKSLPHYGLATFIQANQMKDRFAKINAYRV
jgi:hypothetical protein